jgi:hypothetical protein
MSESHDKNMEEWKEFQRQQHIKTFTVQALDDLNSLETEFKIIFDYLGEGELSYDRHEIMKRIKNLQKDMASCINAQYGNSYQIP